MSETHEDTQPRAELAGEVVTFKTSGCGTEISLTEVRNALSAAGLDSDEARDLLPRNAFRRALRKMAADRTIDSLEDEGSSVRFQLTQKTIDDAGLVEYDREAVLSLDDNGIVTCDGSQLLASTAQQLIGHVIGVRTGRDLKSLVKRLFIKKTSRDLYCINAESGGTYFVPETHREFTSKIAKFLSACGGELRRFPVPRGNEEGNKSIGNAISEGITRFVEELDNAVDDWDVDTRESTRDNLSDKYEQAVLKAQGLREFLGVKVEELEARVQQSKQKMARKIFAIGEEKEAAESLQPELPFVDSA